jgi:hypothetical protein
LKKKTGFFTVFPQKKPNWLTRPSGSIRCGAKFQGFFRRNSGIEMLLFCDNDQGVDRSAVESSSRQHTLPGDWGYAIVCLSRMHPNRASVYNQSWYFRE